MGAFSRELPIDVSIPGVVFKDDARFFVYVKDNIPDNESSIGMVALLNGSSIKRRERHE